MKETDILIIGAGCAGTSLAHHLETEGFAGRIEIFDSRTNFDREQRWCSWGEMPVSFKPLLKHSWKKWVVSDKKNFIESSSESHVYNQIYAPDFFRYFHNKWLDEKSPTRLNLGEKIIGIHQKENFAEIETGTGKIRAGLVFDARNNGSPNLDVLDSTRSVYLHQSFLGWHVKFDRPVFEADTAVLMDFSVKQRDGLSFMYILPYSENEALLESTCFSETPLGWEFHLANVEDYLFEHFGKDYVILSEESGVLPMTTAPINSKIAKNIYAIGIAGGHARPSSGYAFNRIQRHTRQIAEAVIKGEPIPHKFTAKKFDIYDVVFLQALKMKPEIAHEFFIKLFAKVESESLIRFLLDESDLKDDLKVITAMPKIDFLKACVKNIADKFNFLKNAGTKNSKSNGNLRNSVDTFAARPVVRDVHRY